MVRRDLPNRLMPAPRIRANEGPYRRRRDARAVMKRTSLDSRRSERLLQLTRESHNQLFYMCPRNGMSGEDVDVRHLLGGCRTVAAFGAFRS
jgi:hypothetical protein